MILFATVVINGCASVEIKNHEFCSDIGELGATCFKSLSDETRDIPADEWATERVGMICESPDVFGDWKAVIMKLCHKSKACRYQAEEKLQNFFNKIEQAGK